MQPRELIHRIEEASLPLGTGERFAGYARIAALAVNLSTSRAAENVTVFSISFVPSVASSGKLGRTA